MRRPALAAVVLATAAAVASWAAGAGARPTPRREPVRPNVIVIMTDDQTVESLRVMPNVERLLAAQGTTFENSFATFPLCCPSRATFLTGQYSHNHGVVGNTIANGLSRFDETKTLAVALQRGGYATALVGKYLNGYGVTAPRRIPPGWSEWHAPTLLAYFDWSLNDDGTLVRYGRDVRSYMTDVLTEKAVDVVSRRARAERPFFLWLSYFAPHEGAPREADDPAGLRTPVPAPRHHDVFADEPLPKPPSFDEADVSDKPVAIRRLRPLTPQDVAAIREGYQQRLESLLAVDEGVAAVVGAVTAAGALPRTLFFFTSDNGFVQGEHRIRAGKVVLYEPSARVPLIVRGPGVPPHQRLEQPVANIDLAPTIAAAAGVRLPWKVDGVSLLPLFSDPGLEWGRDLLLERGPRKGARPLATAIRTPGYMYSQHSDGERELYDLTTDPDELENLRRDPGYEAISAELAARLASLEVCAGAACRRSAALGLALEQGDGCDRAAAVVGADEPLVRHAELLADGRAVASDDARPFELPLTGLGAERVRVLTILDDGRRQTLDQVVHACAS